MVPIIILDLLGKQAEKPIIVSKELQRKTNNSNGRNNALGSKKSTLSKLWNISENLIKITFTIKINIF